MAENDSKFSVIFIYFLDLIVLLFVFSLDINWIYNIANGSDIGDNPGGAIAEGLIAFVLFFIIVASTFSKLISVFKNSDGDRAGKLKLIVALPLFFIFFGFFPPRNLQEVLFFPIKFIVLVILLSFLINR
ncbi:hypothetical protein, partial [Leptospira wolffii]